MDKELQEGERLYWPHSIDQVREEHLSRYGFFSRYLKPDWVCLDAACGSGYGSNILSDRVSKVVGIDVSDHGLGYARKNYQKNNLEFRKGDLNKNLDFPDNYFNAIASFETLEHISEQTNMLKEFNRVLKPGGVLVISTPDRDIMSGLAGVQNKFHIKELDRGEFLSLLKDNFKIEAFFGQTRFKGSIIAKFASHLRKVLFLRKLKQWFSRNLGLASFFHKRATEVLSSDIISIDKTKPNKEFYVLLAVARKKG